MTRYGADGSVLQEGYITMPEEDLKHGYSHEDSYVCRTGKAITVIW